MSVRGYVSCHPQHGTIDVGDRMIAPKFPITDLTTQIRPVHRHIQYMPTLGSIANEERNEL